MKRKNRRGRRDSSGRLLRADGSIDRRRPPTEHQFQPGQSGYPKGRRKGSKNTDTILRAIMDRKINIRVGGTVKRISIREAMLTRFTEDALKGNTKSAAFLLNRYDAANTGEQPDGANHEQDHEIIDAFAKRLLKAESKSKP